MDIMVISSPAVEGTPNASPPDDERLVRAPSALPKGYELERSKFMFWIENGVSAEVSIWARTASGSWILLESAISIPNTLEGFRSTVDMPPGAYLFVQVTAVTAATAIYGAFV